MAIPLDSATFDDVLLAVRARLLERVGGALPETCWICMDAGADPPVHPGSFGFAIAPYSGTFDEGMFDSGGGNQACLQAGFAVVIWSTVLLDEANRETVFLTDKSQGVLRKATEVLAALCGGGGWRPARKDDFLTRDCVMPASMSFMRSSKFIGGVQLNFRVAFDWLLEVPAGE